MAPRLRSAVVCFDALPVPVLRVIFLALPVDERARAACVCRAWRAFLLDVSLWQVLDLTAAGGVAAERVTENLARGAVGRAAGHLRVLTWTEVDTFAMDQLLVAVIVSDGAGLQHVNTGASLTVAQLQTVLAAAPRLQALNANVSGPCAALIPVLRNDPPYGPMRVSRLLVGHLLREEAAAAVVLALAAAVAAHESLKGLSLNRMASARGVNALVDAAAERRLSSLAIHACNLDGDTVPALARLLQRGSLSSLLVECLGFPLAQETSVPVLCAALRSCRTLRNLTLRLSAPNGADRRTVAELLDAVASLPALSYLNLRDSSVQDSLAFGRALGALLGANLPSLLFLRVNDCRLGDEGLGALLDGLAANTHLRFLQCEHNDLSEAFERDRLAPALAALARGTR